MQYTAYYKYNIQVTINIIYSLLLIQETAYYKYNLQLTVNTIYSLL